MTAQSISEAVQSLAKLFEGKSRDEQKALLGALERAGAVYRALAANEPDAAVAKELLACAEREEQNAAALEQ